DLAQVMRARYNPDAPDRLSPADLATLRQGLAEKGMRLRGGVEADQKLTALRLLYEPYVQALAATLRITLPLWISTVKVKDNWRSSPWDKLIEQKQAMPVSLAEDHF